MLKPYILSTITLRLSLYETHLPQVEKIVFVRHQLACGGLKGVLTVSTSNRYASEIYFLLELNFSNMYGVTF
jgi:hypothetical protein